MIKKLNKKRLLNGLVAVLLAITLIVPAVFQGQAQAASKRTPTRPAICLKSFSTFPLFLPLS